VAKTIAVDEYVLDVLMRDIVGHDRMPSAFLVYLHLWSESHRQSKAWVRASHRTIAQSAGLSKSSTQKAIRYLEGRTLVRSRRASRTATPEYRVLRTWRR